MVALELAHFYGWTLDYINSLTMSKLDLARKYLVQFKKNEDKSQGGEKK